ncbi:vascular cell adhesion protein 1-like [Protopterus annectens]|uniref:vascular cell adhesion protein 1-like n=1 Tax=Protopterus annectens TaxID=7888 RepID=UPI001CF94A68|nr:vascular cell adhesion protein 1-like [Protopterus annectens]
MELTGWFSYLPLALLIALSRCMGVNSLNKDVVVRLGDNVTLSCDTPTNCPVDLEFSWQYVDDKSLEGTKNKLSYTFHSVQIKDEGAILCKTYCNINVVKEQMYQLSVYSFPSEPVLKWKHPLVAGQTASITCEVSNVYPSERMTITLSKDGISLEPTHSTQEGDSDKPETISHDYEFVPTSEDNEKNINCNASLDFSDKGHGNIEKMSLPDLSRTTRVPTSLSKSSTIPDTVSTGATTVPTAPSKISTIPVSSGSTVMHTSTYKSSTVPASSGATKVPTSPYDGSTIPVYSGRTTVSTTLSEISTIPASSESTTVPVSPKKSNTFSASSESTTVPVSPKKSNTFSVSSGSTVMHTSTYKSTTVPASSGATKVPTSPYDGSTIPVYSGRTTVSTTLSEINTIPASSESTTVPVSPKKSNTFSASSESTTVPVSPKKSNTFSAIPGYATPFYSHYTNEEKLWLPFAVVSPVAVGLILGSLLKRRKNKKGYPFGTTTV